MPAKLHTPKEWLPPIRRIFALLLAFALLAAATFVSPQFSPGKEAAWFGLHFLPVVILSCAFATPLIVGLFCVFRLPAFTIALPGVAGAGVILLTALNLDFRKEMARFDGSEGRRAFLLIDDSDDVGSSLVFRVEHADGSLAGEATIPGPILFDSADVNRWSLRLREFGGQLQVTDSRDRVVAWYTPASGKISTRAFDPSGGN